MSKLRQAIDNIRHREDLGLDRAAVRGKQQTIRKDGSYNMERVSKKPFANFHPYHWIITTS